jgi:hypothetical protein
MILTPASTRSNMYFSISFSDIKGIFIVRFMCQWSVFCFWNVVSYDMIQCHASTMSDFYFVLLFDITDNFAMLTPDRCSRD